MFERRLRVRIVEDYTVDLALAQRLFDNLGLGLCAGQIRLALCFAYGHKQHTLARSVLACFLLIESTFHSLLRV